MIEASFYEDFENDSVRCRLCPHNCVIKAFQKGKCGVRENRYGKLYSNVYGKVITLAVDPIEKKPLFHFEPGKKTLSIATIGCNFTCSFCQNSNISQGYKTSKHPPGKTYSPQHILDLAKEKNTNIISFTYSEPTIAFEYYKDIMKLGKDQGFKFVFVTNGYINLDPLKELKGLINAANIDLKSFNEEFYKKEVCGKLQPVLDAIKLYYDLGIHIEITTLVIPTKNDTEDNFRKIAQFIFDLDPTIPWHISRFFPHFMLKDLPPTPIETLKKAADIGREVGLKNIYLGNV
jgi:pyruvate formate lyase activating enzyme